MSNKTKIWLTVIVFLCIILAQGVVNLAQPEIATELAMKQFAEPSIATDTFSRWYESNPVFTAMWFSYGICVFWMFASSLRKKE